MADIKRVERWVARLQELGEADVPMQFGSYSLTPREVLSHARANDAIWQQIMTYIP